MPGPICLAPVLPDTSKMSPIDFVRSAWNAKRCGKPAVFMTPLQRPVCAECGEKQKRDHESGNTLLSILGAGKEFKLTPIQ